MFPVSYNEIPEYEELLIASSPSQVVGSICCRWNKLCVSVRSGIHPCRHTLVISREHCWGFTTLSLQVFIWFLSHLWPFTVNDSLWLSCSSQETHYACGWVPTHPLTFRDLRKKDLGGKFDMGHGSNSLHREVEAKGTIVRIWEGNLVIKVQKERLFC